jgi:integrase
VANWRAQVRVHLLPKFGPSKVDQISVAHVEAFQIKKRNLSPRTVGGLHTTLAAILDLAIKSGSISANPVHKAEKPFAAAKEINVGVEHDPEDRENGVVRPEDVLNPAEIGRLLEAAEPGLYATMFTTAALTGMRSGELFALRWSDIELGNIDGAAPRIFVRRSLSWARRDGEEGEVAYKFYPPKTEAGVRDFEIAPELVSILRTRKLRCPPSGDLNLVFCTAVGTPIRRSNALRYGLWPALSRAGLRRVNMHSLRHSFASALLMDGTDPITVAKLLGSVARKSRSMFTPTFSTAATPARWVVWPGRSSLRPKRLAPRVGTFWAPQGRKGLRTMRPARRYFEFCGFFHTERWPSGRRHQIANLASWVTGTEGSNPSLSAK